MPIMPLVRVVSCSCAALVVCTIVFSTANGQQPDPVAEAHTPPEQQWTSVDGRWDRVRSIGQPPQWKPFIALGFGVDRTVNPDAGGLTASWGFYRDLTNPIYAWLGVNAQAYLGHRGSLMDGGLRAELESRAVFLHGGLDWNARLNRTDIVLGTTFPVQRGGWLLAGAQLRLDWIPSRRGSLMVQAVVPTWQPLAGRTRPRRVDVQLPSVTRGPFAPLPAPEAALDAALGRVEATMISMVALQKFFWLIQEEKLGYRATVESWRGTLAAIRQVLVAQEEMDPRESAYNRQVESYHGAMESAFTLATGGDVLQGREAANAARRFALEEVVLPYNRTIGQYKRPDALDGLAARSRARFVSWLEVESGVLPRRQPYVLLTFEEWIAAVERLHTSVSDLARDGRMNWLPMALVLRPADHRTRPQIDEIVTRALGRGFEGGNATQLVNAPQFQRELVRSIHETRHYHVLWVHDFRGRNVAGDPDRVAFEVVRSYLRALSAHVRAYDETQRFPTFLILLDQYYYELNGSRLWMSLLEAPRTHRVRLSPQYAWMSDSLELLQDSLRSAIAGSRRLQAESRALGAGWTDALVKVHVNITNPSDLTFRSRRIFIPPFGADNMLRDHRKIVLRDALESDPGSGELMLAGVGVGEHYAGPTWDDPALIVQGPGVHPAREHIRALLARHQIGGAATPPALRAVPRAPDWTSAVARREAAGATAQFLQVHNRTGWGDKDATFVQMLLYDLAPAGTMIFAPSSLWTSYQWVAQLVSAALRGCHVYIVAPALANAPSAGYAQMSVMQELLTRLTLVEEALGDAIRMGGGDLRVGLSTRETPLDDMGELLRELDEALDAYPFLAERFPFSADSREVLRRAAARLESDEGREAVGRRPQLHRKTQWMISSDVVSAVMSDEAFPEVLASALDRVVEAELSPTESGPIVEQERAATTRALLHLHEGVNGRGGGSSGGGSSPGDRVGGDDHVMYFMTGSMNMAFRSMALDGEALGVVAGPWALQPLLDFLLLSAGITWVRQLSDVEEHLPPYSNFQRRVGRILHRIM